MLTTEAALQIHLTHGTSSLVCPLAAQPLILQCYFATVSDGMISMMLIEYSEFGRANIARTIIKYQSYNLQAGKSTYETFLSSLGKQVDVDYIVFEKPFVTKKVV